MSETSARISVDGELFGVADPAGHVAGRYAEGGADALSRLRGFYSIAVDDGHRTTLASDQIGSRPLYYVRRGERVLHARSVHELLSRLEGSPDQDRRGIADFLQLGFVLGQRTYFEGISLVPAATTLVFERGAEVSRRTWWRFHYGAAPGGPRTTDQWVEALGATFLRACEEMNPEPGPFSVPLSGGMDSRAILAALHALGKTAVAYTIGDPACLEVPIAREVARRLGAPHHVWTMTPADVLTWLEDGVRATDGMFLAFDAHILFLARRLRAQSGVALDGTSSCDGFYSVLDLARRRLAREPTPWPILAATVFTGPLFDARGEPSMPELFAPSRREELRAHLHAALRELQDSIPAELQDPFDRIDFLEMSQRIRRYTLNGTVLLRAHREVRHPWFHPDVLALVGTMPVSLRRKEKPAVARMVTRLAPALAGVPYERTGLPGEASAARILVAAALRYARRKLPLGPRPRTRVAIDYLGFLREDRGLQDFVRATLLGDQALSRGLFEPDAVRRLVEDNLAGRRSTLALLSRMLSLELWQRGLSAPSPAQRDSMAPRSGPAPSGREKPE